MLNIENIKIGDPVYYKPPHYFSTGKHENGIVKEIVDKNNVRVVYHCNNQWDKFMNYTSALTRTEDLFEGWK